MMLPWTILTKTKTDMKLDLYAAYKYAKGDSVFILMPVI